jgi:hypothetical protein
MYCDYNIIINTLMEHVDMGNKQNISVLQRTIVPGEVILKVRAEKESHDQWRLVARVINSLGPTPEYVPLSISTDKPTKKIMDAALLVPGEYHDVRGGKVVIASRQNLGPTLMSRNKSAKCTT